MPRSLMPSRAYAIGAAHRRWRMVVENDSELLHTDCFKRRGGGSAKIHAGCLTSLRLCGLCDVALGALKYLKQDPHAGWNIIPPKCK